MVFSEAILSPAGVGSPGSFFSIGSGDTVASDLLDVDLLGSSDLWDILDRDLSTS